MWLKPQGYACITGPDGITELNTTQCSHCQRLTHVKAGMRPEDIGGFCRGCMKPVCAQCADGPCVPFMKRIEEMEDRDYRRRAYDR